MRLSASPIAVTFQDSRSRQGGIAWVRLRSVGAVGGRIALSSLPQNIEFWPPLSCRFNLSLLVGLPCCQSRHGSHCSWESWIKLATRHWRSVVLAALLCRMRKYAQSRRALAEGIVCHPLRLKAFSIICTYKWALLRTCSSVTALPWKVSQPLILGGSWNVWDKEALCNFSWFVMTLHFRGHSWRKLIHNSINTCTDKTFHFCDILIAKNKCDRIYSGVRVSAGMPILILVSFLYEMIVNRLRSFCLLSIIKDFSKAWSLDAQEQTRISILSTGGLCSMMYVNVISSIKRTFYGLQHITLPQKILALEEQAETRKFWEDPSTPIHIASSGYITLYNALGLLGAHEVDEFSQARWSTPSYDAHVYKQLKSCPSQRIILVK